MQITSRKGYTATKRSATTTLCLVVGTVCCAILTALVSGCARMGQPDGGWYDDTPPYVVGSSPADKATNVKSRKVIINFNEFIKLEDANNKVTVSPPQLEMPEVKASGKRIIVDIKDSLKSNTTYTIDFSDAISDNNEGNPMGNYTYSFATGGHIDTLEVSGYVLNASNLEPIKGILVGLYNDLSDTAFLTKPMVRVARTDSRGRFVVKGVAPGIYRAYALQDADGNYMYSQKSETLAFSKETFEPYSKPDIRQDTIWRDTLRIDSISRVNYTHFYPDNIVLRAFTVPQTDRYLLKTTREAPERIAFYFSYGDTDLPILRGLNFDSEGKFITEASEKLDTVTYWMSDSALINNDTLRIEATYMTTDTTGTLMSKTDTVEFVPKVSYAKRLKEKAKEEEKGRKNIEKAKKKGEPYDSIMPVKSLEPNINAPSAMAPDQNIVIKMPSPLSRCDTSAIHLYSKHDSLWYNARCEFKPIEGRLREYMLRAEWRPGIEYSLEIDSAAFEDLYGLVSKPIKKGIQVQQDDAFSSLVVETTATAGDTSTIIIQLLNTSDAPVKQAVVSNGQAEFFYVTPGTYYLRAFSDTNGNGIWDTGDYYAGLQPETVYYYPKAVECKAKWDVTIGWNLNSTPAERQKPGAITKQKPDKDKKQRNRNAERAQSLGIQQPKR